MAIKDTLVTDGIYQGWTCDDYVGPTGTEDNSNVHYGSHGSDAAVTLRYYSEVSGCLTTVSDVFEQGVDATRDYNPGNTDNGYIYGFTNVTVDTLTSETAFTLEAFMQIDSISSWNYTTGWYPLLTLNFSSSSICGIEFQISGGQMQAAGYVKYSGNNHLRTAAINLAEGSCHLAVVAWESGSDIHVKLYYNGVTTAETSTTSTFDDSQWTSSATELICQLTPAYFSSSYWYDFTIGDFGWYKSALSSTTIEEHSAFINGPKFDILATGSLAVDQWFMAYINDGTPPKSLCVEADISGCLSSTLSPGLFLRYQDQGTFYVVMLNKETSKWDLVLMNSGARTTVASSGTFTIDDDTYHVALSVVDSTFIVTVDNVEVINTTNSTITAAGKYGISYRG